MSSEWSKALTISELLSQKGGSIKTGPFGTALKASEYVQIGVPLISVREIGHGVLHIDNKTPRVCEATLSRLPEYILQEGDIVFARKGGIERCALIRSQQAGWFLGSDGIRLRPPESCDARFIAYALQTKSVKDWLLQNSTGSTMASLNQATIGRLPLALPTINEQNKIADTLEVFDDRIALLRETNATLEAIAQALFKSWFIDFDPVHAKARGEPPQGMDDATAALFPDSFEESELGMVPKEWRVQSFTQTINVIGGGTPKTSIAEYWNGDIPWFSVVDAPTTTDVFVIGTEKHITVAGLNNSSTKLLPVGTTIISARGTVGRLALVGTEMAMNQSCYGLRGKAGDAYFTYFSTYRLVETLKQRTHGSVFDTITRDTLTGVSVIYPTTAVINAFEEAIAPVMERLKENLKQAQTLAQLRDTLLPKLISGQLRLPEAEALLKETNLCQ
ncbi:restriction endonuclease subunit S [Pseudaeromonas sp. ZJS20]|uniref:restriction endonuclease subunit S n=1 Tax=Pseudaeromonas aegiceratis TaxID=3153928 RepID=UPI00390CB7E3